MTNDNRVPAGSPEGGQFAAGTNPESAMTSLGSSDAAKATHTMAVPTRGLESCDGLREHVAESIGALDVREVGDQTVYAYNSVARGDNYETLKREAYAAFDDYGIERPTFSVRRYGADGAVDLSLEAEDGYESLDKSGGGLSDEHRAAFAPTPTPAPSDAEREATDRAASWSIKAANEGRRDAMNRLIQARNDSDRAVASYYREVARATYGEQCAGIWVENNEPGSYDLTYVDANRQPLSAPSAERCEHLGTDPSEYEGETAFFDDSPWMRERLSDAKGEALDTYDATDGYLMWSDLDD